MSASCSGPEGGGASSSGGPGAAGAPSGGGDASAPSRGRQGGGPRLCIVSGLSGAGRTTVVKALEDLGFYCVDNLPVGLLDAFLDLFGGRAERLAAVIDVREREFLGDCPAAVDALRARGALSDLLFLDASDEVLAQRFDETRRAHPAGAAGGLAGAIARERALLAPLADRADAVLDTTRMSVHDLRRFIARRYAQGPRGGGLRVELISFGFRYGLPDLTDLLLDVRFLANPHTQRALRARTGEDPEVARYVLEGPHTRAFLERTLDFLDFLLPLYEAEGKSYLMIAVGCTGGQHRSVAVVAALEQRLAERKIEVRAVHRDVWRAASAERSEGSGRPEYSEGPREWAQGSGTAAALPPAVEEAARTPVAAERAGDAEGREDP